MTAEQPTTDDAASSKASPEPVPAENEPHPEPQALPGDRTPDHARLRPEPPAGETARPAQPATDRESFGRVDTDGTVYVRTSTGERAVGQWPGGDPAAALTFYRNRYAGLATEVDLLERRIAAGALSPTDATKAVDRLRSTVSDAAAVGDLDALATRLDQLSPTLERAREAHRAERAAQATKTRAARLAIVEQAEALATGGDWNAGPARLRDLVERWKALPRQDKIQDGELWQRLSAARTAFTKRRRQHFAELDDRRRAAAATKQKLIIEAEALATSTDWGETSRAFRDLMTRWKAAGSARRETEDTLWKRFRAAQDTFFTARDAQTAAVDAKYAANAEAKRAVLAEAEQLPMQDPRAARKRYRALAVRWDAAGPVPRQEMKDLEGRFSRVDEQIRRAEDDRWRRSNPEASARAAATVAQLEASIAAGRDRLGAAQARGDERAAAQARSDIETRESWLEQARATRDEFSG